MKVLIFKAGLYPEVIKGGIFPEWLPRGPLSLLDEIGHIEGGMAMDSLPWLGSFSLQVEMSPKV
jgi:hypothetical protein